MNVRDSLAPIGATRRQRDLLAVSDLLGSGLSVARTIRLAGLPALRTLGMIRWMRSLRISPVALADLMARCEPDERPIVLHNLIRSRRWDRKARRLLARRQAKGGRV